MDFSLSKFFKKCPKTAFLTVFLEICLRRRKFSQNGGKKCFGRSSKNQFGRPKKKKKGRQNFRIFFENPPPPRENSRSAPACGAEKFGQNRILLGFSESSENQIGRTKKSRQNFQFFSEKPPSPLEKFLRRHCYDTSLMWINF